MEPLESTRIVFNRIEKLEPENVSKIVGYLLQQENGDRDMIRLAFSPDNAIFSLINKVKLEMGLSSEQGSTQTLPSTNSEPISNLPIKLTPFLPGSSYSFSFPPTYSIPTSYWEEQLFSPNYPEFTIDDSNLQNQTHHSLVLDDQLEHVNSVGHDGFSNYYFLESAFGNLNSRICRRSPSLPEFPVKTCHYFNKGFCKHGNNCRYFHGQPLTTSFSQSFNGGEVVREENVFCLGSLEKLEMELTELLRARRGYPISIASLPMLYYEKYGRTLQAEGYLTESQRHGKSGYSLTKLLARLKNSIQLIDRPHGQHAVVLAEDAPNFMEYRGDKADPGGVVSGSRQIYLTFPAESTFTEEDVANYFTNYGPVQDVRIPCQQKRMFGFVTFVHPETVKMILTKGNPHFVRGARVLIKPYREKSRLVVGRKYSEKIESPIYNPSHFLTMHDSELHSVHGVRDTSRLLRKQFIGVHEQALELERRRLSELQLATKPIASQPYLGFMEDFKLPEDFQYSSTTDRFSYLLDVINDTSTSDDRARNTNYADQESGSQCINLPESPFASPIVNSVSAVM